MSEQILHQGRLVLFLDIGVFFWRCVGCERYPLPLSSTRPLALPCRFQPPRLVEVLLLIWGVFFIATVNTTPEQKARNFDKPIQRGKDIMRMKRPSPPPAEVSDAADTSEEQPNWDLAHGGPLQATGSSTGGTVPAK